MNSWSNDATVSGDPVMSETRAESTHVDSDVVGHTEVYVPTSTSSANRAENQDRTSTETIQCFTSDRNKPTVNDVSSIECNTCTAQPSTQAPSEAQFLSDISIPVNSNDGATLLTPESTAQPVIHSSALSIISMFEPDPQALRNLIINYLPPLMDESQMYQLFSQFGPIDSVKIIYDKQTRVSRGYGFLKFMYFFSATYAIACLNRFQIAGKRLKVAYANVDAAQEALQRLREQKLKTFSPQQKIAYTTMYNNQIMHAQE